MTHERLARLIPRGAKQWTAATIAALLLLAWAGGACWLGSAMFNEHNPERARFKCEHPAGVFGTSTWQWWPPGRVCHYHDGTIAEPITLRAFVMVALAVTAVVGVVLGLVYAHRRDVFRAGVGAPKDS